MDKFRIVTIGYLLTDWLLAVDHLPIQAGEHQPLKDLHIEAGGISNFLIAGQRLGAQMVVLDALGWDENAKFLLTELKKEGVDCSQVIKIRGARSRAVAVLQNDVDGHTYLPYAGTELPCQELSSEWKAQINGAQALYVDGFALRQEYISSAALKGLRLAHDMKKLTWLDAGPGAAELSRDVLQHCFTVSLTESELQAWVGLGGKEGAWSLLDCGSELVVVKQGSAGCTLYTNQATLVCPGFTVDALDTLGAGDVFNSAFMVTWLQGKPLSECGRFANAAGAAQTLKIGAGRNVPGLQQIINLLTGKK